MAKKKDRDGAGREAYVLVLREHEEQGSGYSLELAPLAASDAPQRARGGASSGAAEAGAAPGTGSRAQGSGPTSEAAAGGAPSRARGRAPTREAATTTGAAPRARGHSLAREEAATATAAGRPPRPRGSQARGRDTAADVAAGGPCGGEGEGYGRDVAEVGDDIAGEAGDRILSDMRRLLFSQPQDYFSQPQLVKSDDTSSKVHERDREVLIPVFMSPKKKNKGKNNKDDIWNKRQIMYGIALLGLLGFVPAILAFLPRWALFVFAAVWGVSSIGFPFGLFGTSRLETGYSRHMGRFVFMGFCLVVMFMLYQYMALIGNSPQPEAIAPPPSSASHSSARIETKWTVGFAILGVIVMAGHIFSWARGCCTGSDDDESESSGEEDVRPSDLLQRLLATQ